MLYFLVVLIQISEGRVHLTQHESEEYVRTTVPVRVGAKPGLEHVFLFDPASDTYVPKYHQLQSSYYRNNTDVIYVKNGRAIIDIITTTENPVLGSDTLCKMSNVWGVCNNVLYFHELPRKCKNGIYTPFFCDIKTCPVWFNMTQHTIHDCSKNFTVGGTSIKPNCNNVISVGKNGRFLPSYYETPNMPERISIWQQHANYEYDCEHKEFNIFIPTKDLEENTMDYIIVIISILTIVVWFEKMQLIYKKIDELWNHIEEYSFMYYSIIMGVTSNKLYSYAMNKSVFFPETLDNTYGTSFANWYIRQHMIIVLILLVFVSFVFVIIGIRIFSGFIYPPCLNDLIYKIHKNMKDNKYTTLLALRWTYDYLLFTTFHINFPQDFKDETTELIGLMLGCTLCALSTLCFLLIVKKSSSIATFALCLILFCICITHASIFMIHPIIGHSDDLSPIMSAILSYIISICFIALGMNRTHLFLGLS